jgi:hypothetical protein
MNAIIAEVVTKIHGLHLRYSNLKRNTLKPSCKYRFEVMKLKTGCILKLLKLSNVKVTHCFIRKCNSSMLMWCYDLHTKYKWKQL